MVLNGGLRDASEMKGDENQKVKPCQGTSSIVQEQVGRHISWKKVRISPRESTAKISMNAPGLARLLLCARGF